MLRTPLYETHLRHKARMVEFAGWEMPVQYTSIIAEVKAVREKVGIFDVSHMGKFELEGDISVFQPLLTCNVEKMDEGQVRYCLLCNERGGVIDDLTVWRRWESCLVLVVNASRREVDWNWMLSNSPYLVALLPNRFFADLTIDGAMLAVQGPQAAALMDSLCDHPPSILKRFYGCDEFELCGKGVWVTRTGYTGEDGFEIMCKAEHALEVWDKLVQAGATPCGLGARDVLRLEAGMCLYGHELTEDIMPVEADLMRFVDMSKDFIGKEAIERQLKEGIKRKRVGLVLNTRQAAREHYKVFDGDKLIGEVTSGSYSPTLERSIAMAYLHIDYTEPGTKVQVEIRDQRLPAEVVTLPFYRRKLGN